MSLAYFLVLSLLSLSTVVAKNGFVSPKFQSTTNSGSFAGASLWPLGSSQLVAFTSTWDDYRIELWQQSMTEGSATLSETLVYNQTAGEDLPQSFYWTVQTYELQLADSPVFFFWLRDNDSDEQQSSAFFNVTIEAVATASASISTTSSMASGATSSASTLAITAKSSRSTTPSEYSATATTILPSINTSGSSVQATMTGDMMASDRSGGLSSSAVTGIGVAVSIVGTAALVGAGFTYWNRRKKRNMTASREPPAYLPSDHWANNDMPLPESGYFKNLPPELPQYGRHSPVEMSET